MMIVISIGTVSTELKTAHTERVNKVKLFQKCFHISKDIGTAQKRPHLLHPDLLLNGIARKRVVDGQDVAKRLKEKRNDKTNEDNK